MAADPPYGPRLSEEEYQERVISLHTLERPAKHLSESEIRRRELDIEIDYRLGLKFPANRRNELWEAQERVSKQRLRMVASGLLNQVLAIRRKRINRLAGAIVKEFGKVMSKSELEMFLGKDEVRHPGLP